MYHSQFIYFFFQVPLMYTLAEKIGAEGSRLKNFFADAANRPTSLGKRLKDVPATINEFGIIFQVMAFFKEMPEAVIINADVSRKVMFISVIIGTYYLHLILLA